MNPKASRFLVCVPAFLALNVGVLGCGTDATLLPADFNSRKVKDLTVKAQVTHPNGPTIASLGGVQGGPQPVVSGGAVLTNELRTANVGILRVPDGYLCDYELGGIFPKANEDVTLPASYAFDKIDAALEVAKSIDGVQIVWQAMYDIGRDTCKIEGGIEKSAPPKDPARWAQVAVNVLRHWNKALIPETDQALATWRKAAKDLGIRTVEFPSDPMGRGGYKKADAVVADYITLAEAIRTAFPAAAGGQPPMRVVGPAMRIASGDEVAGHAVVAFIDGLVTQKKQSLLDALTFESTATTPAELARIAEQLRSLLKTRGLAAIPVWLTRYQSDPAARPASFEDASAVGLWSAHSGAFASTARIDLQGLVDAAVFYRADLRPLTPNLNDVVNVEQSPLWAPNGQARPGGLSWLHWLFVTGTSRIDAREQGDDDPLMAVLAGRSNDMGSGCPEPNRKPCPALVVLASNANLPSEQARVSYEISILDASTISGAKSLTAYRWPIGRSSTPADVGWTSRKDLPIGAEGTAVLQFEAELPSIDLVVLLPNP